MAKIDFYASLISWRRAHKSHNKLHGGRFVSTINETAEQTSIILTIRWQDI